MSAPVTVLVADDHPLYRDGIARALDRREGLELVAEVGDGDAAFDAIRRLRPDVAVLDIRMPGRDGVEVVEAVRAAGLATRLMLLSAYGDQPLVLAALAAGADGYLGKDADRGTICDAVATVAGGETYLDPAHQAALVGQIARRSSEPVAAPAAPASTLTAREHEVLRLIAEGLSAPAIAERLQLSAATVKTHLGHLYGKLGVSERAAAVAEAMRSGLLV